ncbi:MAG: hypothetical protein K5697_01270 [Lachnospiraceae bacterium]|nr:hypothetical protein [Lachnospiraceae bacterium]
MGRGSYNALDWSRLKSSRNIGTATSEREIFRRRQIDQRFDPRFISFREARDSEDHPESTPIIIGLDVTGSMGYLSKQIAKESLHETMMKLYSLQPVPDPAILFAAYGDFQDQAPLQVTQFESDIRIAEQLFDLWLENAGNGDVVPNYLWHFAAEHTLLDAQQKRGKKGFLFTIGDGADCRTVGIEASFNRVFNETLNCDTKSILKKASEKFEIFHIFLVNNPGDRANDFVQLLSGRNVMLSPQRVDTIPELIISIMQYTNGMKQNDIIRQWPDDKQPVIDSALRELKLPGAKKGLFF